MFVVAPLVLLIDAERSPLDETPSTMYSCTNRPMLWQHGVIFYHAVQHGMFLFQAAPREAIWERLRRIL